MVKNILFKSGFLSFLLLSFSTFLVSRSEICCMFSSVRYYGWPNAFIRISKTTEFLEEAKKIETESFSYLISNGWELGLGGDILGKFGFNSSGVINLILNAIFYFAASFILVSVVHLLTYKKKRD